MGSMVFIMVFCGLCDMIILSNRNSLLTDVGKELARTLSVQGGSLETKPGSFADNYYVISELSGLVKRNMRIAGFKDGEWNVSVKYTRVYNDATSQSEPTEAEHTIFGFDDAGNYYYSPTMKIDYLSDFTVIISGDYNWEMLKFFIGPRKSTMVIPLPGMSEFKYNYDAWQSETPEEE